MKVLHYNIWFIAMAFTFIAGMSLSSCIYDYEVDSDENDNIRINAMVVSDRRSALMDETDNDGFVVLFWGESALSSLKSSNSVFPPPYLFREAPQSVEFYSQVVYDTGYPYPSPETAILYATGYAPASAVTSNDNFRTLNVDKNDSDRGRHDFLGCDLWPEVYRGSHGDPFAKEKNKLYFRHLAAKLVFYADRDRSTMENKQYVRNVQISGLYMSIDGGKEWLEMHTPSQFKWSYLVQTDFSYSYNKTIAAVKATPGNEAVRTTPQYGYIGYASDTFSGNDDGFVLKRNAFDRVPINGVNIDSCYVCNPIEGGAVRRGQQIRLKMNISAELSFHPDFPMNDGGDSSSTTDDLTFTRTWNNVQLDAIYHLDKDGNVITTENGKVKVFKPGNEYRIYIHFHRTGVNLTALEVPWNPGGVHYITISGGDKQPADEDETNK